MAQQQERTIVFILIGLIVAYLVLNMKGNCAIPQPEPTTEGFKNKEEFEPVQSGEDLAENTVQAVNFSVNDGIELDVPTNEDYAEEQERRVAIEAGVIEEDGVLNVEGSDLLLAAAADRFYSIDVKGQSNKNASYDIRGEEPIPYNENYTPFSASHIVGEPKIRTGRL